MTPRSLPTEMEMMMDGKDLNEWARDLKRLAEAEMDMVEETYSDGESILNEDILALDLIHRFHKRPPITEADIPALVKLMGLEEELAMESMTVGEVAEARQYAPKITVKKVEFKKT